MLRALLLVLAVLLTVSCTAADELASDGAAAPSPAAEAPSASASASSPAPTATVSPPPKAGTCRQLRPRDLNSIVNDARDVSCRQRHTSVTYAVGELPRRLADRATSVGDDRVEDAAQRTCRRGFGAYLGGSRAERTLSSLRMTYFLPNAAEFAAGARWVRCEMFAYATDGRLASLPPDLEGALDDSDRADDLGTCSVVAPDHPRFQHIICTLPHSWRAVGFDRLAGAQAAFPGSPTLGRRASRRCEGTVRDYLGTRDRFSYGYEVPSRESWAGGNRLAYCWAQTSS